jgi:hypothetical protein
MVSGKESPCKTAELRLLLPDDPGTYPIQGTAAQRRPENCVHREPQFPAGSRPALREEPQNAGSILPGRRWQKRCAIGEETAHRVWPESPRCTVLLLSPCPSPRFRFATVQRDGGTMHPNQGASMLEQDMEASHVGLMRRMRKRNAVSLPQRAHSNQRQMRPAQFRSGPRALQRSGDESPMALCINFRVPNATMRSAGE